MRHALRRIAFGVIGTGMIAAMAVGTSTVAASAAVSAPQYAAATHHLAALRWPVVRRGDHGTRVRTVQYLLNQHGARLGVDGIFGVPTELAVKNFQRGHGLFPDGVVGNATWMKLIVTVRHGSRGDAVRAVQDQLRFQYGYHYVDGVFGAKTETAVRDFQHRFLPHMPADGIVGTFTWNALVVNDR